MTPERFSWAVSDRHGTGDGIIEPDLSTSPASNVLAFRLEGGSRR